MKKVVCTHCYYTYEPADFKEEQVCPKCGKVFGLSQGEKLYQMVLVRHMNDGYKYLNELMDYKKAIESYSRLILLELSEDAVLYLIEAYIKDSKVREDHLKEILNTLNQYKEILTPNEDNKLKVNDYYSEIIYLLSDYELGLKKNLSKNDKFYSLEARHIYLNKNSQIVEILSFIDENFFKDVDYTEDATIKESELLEIIESIKENGSKNYEIIENSGYVLAQDEEGTPIKDNIFKDGSKFVKTKRFLTALSGLSVIALIIGLVLIFSIKDNIYPGVITLAISAAGFIISFVARLIISKLVN